MYDEKGFINTIILKRFSSGTISKFHLYDENNREMSENWNFGTFLDNKYTFEIAEEKLTNDLKNALKVLGKYCECRDCDNCVFGEKNGISFYCGLKGCNPLINYKKYVGEKDE